MREKKDYNSTAQRCFFFSLLFFCFFFFLFFDGTIASVSSHEENFMCDVPSRVVGVAEDFREFNGA